MSKRKQQRGGGGSGMQTRSTLKRKANQMTNPNTSPWGGIAKRFRDPIGQLPPGAKLVRNIKVSPPVKLDAWNQLRDEVMSIPIYVILCHSSLCISYKSCRTPSRKNIDAKVPTFFIPASTYILNFTAGGEYCLFGSYRAFLAKKHREEFRKLLLVRDRNDIIQTADINPFVAHVLRAADIEYPNIGCTFVEHDEGAPNELGVFDLSTATSLTNDASLIKATELGPYGDDTWYLDDIIAETYKRTGTSTGIFLFTGCSSAFRPARKAANLISAVGKAIDVAQSMIYLAETSYSTLKPTLEGEEIVKLDPTLLATNVGTRFAISRTDPTAAALYAHALEEPVEMMNPELEKEDPANLETAKKILQGK